MLALLFLWFGISFPLVFIGFYFGYRKQPYEHPVRTNQIPRQIPEQPWYLSPFLSSTVAGILPFGAIFVELFFILSVRERGRGRERERGREERGKKDKELKGERREE